MRKITFLLSVVAIPCAICLMIRDGAIWCVALIAAVSNSITYCPFNKK